MSLASALVASVFIQSCGTLPRLDAVPPELTEKAVIPGIPNARFWLGESYYGKKDFSRAIDAYDQVQLNHPASEKVPAALLKKGYAYLALKDRKKAASALKQVIDLYPKSPEANKAMDKLNQLKELH